MVRALLAIALLSPALWADRVVTTPRIAIQLRLGSPSRLENRLTGEVLNLQQITDAPWVELPKERIAQAEADKGSDDAFAVKGKLSCRTQATTGPDGDVVLTQQAQVAKPGLRGVGWGMAGVSSKDVQVVVPGGSGCAFGRNRGTPFRELTFSWPIGWEAGFVLLQMEKGGFIVWAKDPNWQYKRFRLRHAKGLFSLRFQSEAEAPFEKVSQLQSVPWHVAAYRGDWREGAKIYRSWLRARLKPPMIAKRTPTWVGETNALVISGMKHEIIQELAKHVAPARTVLYVPSWRRDGYDMNYPDYTPVPEFAPFVAEAHRLGFRVMAHVNYFGCDPKHPLYESFEPYQLRSPGSDKRQWWTWPRDLEPDEEPRIKFAYIHPGLKAWRQELVQRFTKLVEETGVDSLHLDQTLCLPNHNRGRVDGLSVPEGNLALHRDLRAALPDVALSGEGLDEVTFLYEAFAQRHAARAVNHVTKAWDDRFIRTTHPICSYLFAPHTTINGYLGMSNPRSGGVWDAWVQAYELWGSIPTFARPSLNQLRQPKTRDALSLAKLGLWTQYALLPDYDHPETTDTRLMWTGKGATAFVDHSPTGGSQLQLRVGGKDQTIYQYASGIRSLTTKGNIPNWLAYRDRTLFGLTPQRTYLVLPDVPKTDGIHLSALPASMAVDEARANPLFLAADLVDTKAGLVLDLASSADGADASIIGPNTALPLGDGGAFEVTTTADGKVMRQGIFAHPPWKNRLAGKAGPADTTRGRYRVRLPADHPAVLSLALALRGTAEQKSDGVAFRVLVNGKPILDRVWGKAKWERHELSLADYQGQEIQIDLCTSPGPNDDVQFDWAVWGEPVIRTLAKPSRQPIDIASPTPVQAMLDQGGDIPLQALPAPAGQYAYRCQPLLPGPVIACLKDVPTVPLPANLAKLPLQVTILDANGSPAQDAPSFVGVHPAAAASDGTKREGLSAHPPSSGRTVADFALRLPAGGNPRLRLAVGIRDGSESTGCLFLIQVNGKTTWQQLVTGVDGWHEADVDLTAFAGKPIILSLVVDPAGAYNFDWAFWAEPRIVAAPR
ncbi:MAG: hypothetical protein HN380_21745 [Victivallales bacterium]|nr:hypothetical protein [Victivallales bacterium]